MYWFMYTHTHTHIYIYIPNHVASVARGIFFNVFASYSSVYSVQPCVQRTAPQSAASLSVSFLEQFPEDRLGAYTQQENQGNGPVRAVRGASPVMRCASPVMPCEAGCDSLSAHWYFWSLRGNAGWILCCFKWRGTRLFWQLLVQSKFESIRIIVTTLGTYPPMPTFS